MATPNIQHEPATTEGFDPSREPPEERHPIVPPEEQEATAREWDTTVGDGIEDDDEERPLTAAERRAQRGKRGPVKPRLRRDLFGNTGGIK